MKEDALFYVCQKAFLEKDGNILILNDPMEGLDFPGGKVQMGETNFEEALKREVREETSIEIEVGAPFFTWYSDYPVGHRNEGKKVFIVGYKCSYVSGEIKLSDEHDSYRFVNKNNYKEVDDGSSFFEALKRYFTI